MKIFIVLLYLMPSHEVKSTTTTTEVMMTEPTVDRVFYPEVGNYTTQTFEYFNMQNKQYEKFALNNKCYDQYIKCIISQTVPIPVCAYFSFSSSKYMTRNSYCDVYLENCRLGKKLWKILGHGNCTGDGRVQHTLRRMMLIKN